MVIQLQFFTQVFYYVGSQLWNTLLERPELCTCNFGFHLKYAVSELRSWYLLRLFPSRPAHIPSLRLTPLACNRINTQNLHDENFHPSHQLNRILVRHTRTRTHARVHVAWLTRFVLFPSGCGGRARGEQELLRRRQDPAGLAADLPRPLPPRNQVPSRTLHPGQVRLLPLGNISLSLFG
jgi:hypothetical protein